MEEGREKKALVDEIIRKIASHFYTNVFGYFFIPFILRRFKNYIRGVENIHDALEFTFSFQSLGTSIKTHAG